MSDIFRSAQKGKTINSCAGNAVVVSLTALRPTARRDGKSPTKQLDDSPPKYQEQQERIFIPRKDAFAIIRNVNLIMDEVLCELDGAIYDISSIARTIDHIRESCQVAGAVVARTLLSNVTHAALLDDLDQCRRRLLRLFTAIMGNVSNDGKMAVLVIAANAVTKAAYQARSESKDYRATAWAAAVARLAHTIVSRDAMELREKFEKTCLR
jgi:hypothetical protein